MADPNKYKSVSIPRDTYETLEWLRKGNIINAELTFSKVIEYLAKSKIKEIALGIFSLWTISVAANLYWRIKDTDRPINKLPKQKKVKLEKLSE